MKIKTILLFNIVLLSILSLVSAGFPCDWDTYGSDYILMPNYQYYSQCTSLFNQTNITVLAYPQGQNYGNAKMGYQPLVAGLGQSDTPLLIFPNNNYLQIYDKNLDLVTEILVGQKANSQIDVGDLDGNGLVNDIAGVFEINTTQYAFRIYTYNYSTQLLTLQSAINFSANGTDFGTNGVRCKSGAGIYGECASVWYYYNGVNYTYNFIKFFGNETYVSYQIGSHNYFGYPREPLSWTDWDNDGVDEYLVWSDKSIIVFNGNNGVEEKLITADPTNTFHRIKMAKFYVPLQTTQPTWIEELFGITATNQRLIFATETGNTFGCGAGTSYGMTVNSTKSDGSSAWSQCFGTTNSGDTMRNYGFAIADYNGDLKDDVWMVYGQSGSNPTTNFKIFKGDDGTSLYSQGYTPALSFAGGYPNSSVFLVRLDNDATPDFVVYTPTKLVGWSPAKNQSLFSNSTMSISSCIPADLSYDGLQDLICASSSSTTMFTPDYVNQNPTISFVTYDPSTNVGVNSTLNMIITAYDPENDIMVYSHRCSDLDSWSADTYSSTQSCVYGSTGYFENSVRVSDIFHTNNYTTFTQTILVTSTGTACNNNGVCQAELGENYATCPSDCPTPPAQPPVNNTLSEGGIPIPTKIVDVDNTEQGLLPEIYYGILGFLSSTLSPMIMLIFAIFFVLIMLTIGVIIKKIAHKVGDMR